MLSRLKQTVSRHSLLELDLLYLVTAVECVHAAYAKCAISGLKSPVNNRKPERNQENFQLATLLLALLALHASNSRAPT